MNLFKLRDEDTLQTPFEDQDPRSRPQPGTSVMRRRLLGWSVGAFATVGFSGMANALLRYLAPSDNGVAGNRVEVPAGSFALWEAKRIVVRGRPGFAVQTPEGVIAVSGVCTHLGCVVRWQRGRREFFCPCHGGRFAADGRVLGGPLPGPLERFEVAESEGVIVVSAVS